MLKKKYSRRIVSPNINFVYFGVFKKTRSNFFLTIINNVGNVVISLSAGNCKIKSKKKKKSHDTIKILASTISKLALVKNIKVINKFFMTLPLKKNMYTIVNKFRENGLLLREIVYVRKKSHSSVMKKRKLRRM